MYTNRNGRRVRDLPYITSRPSAEWTYQVNCFVQSVNPCSVHRYSVNPCSVNPFSVNPFVLFIRFLFIRILFIGIFLIRVLYF